MAKKKSNSSKSSQHDYAAIGAGVGITAAAAAAAGAYFLYGSKSAKANRKKVKSWMLKAKAEALEALETAENMSWEEYEDLIENIAGTYASLKDASRKDISEFKKEMKDCWTKIEKNASAPKRATRQRSGGPAKKAAKKTAKKTAKKAAKKK